MKITFACVLFFLFGSVAAQVIFCPPGAEWRYRFVHGAGTAYMWNELAVARYVGDSIAGLDTLKKLEHKKFYLLCNSMTGFSNTTQSYLKQKGDTVFFSNFRTRHSWEILYNFACGPGQGWQTNLEHPLNTSDTDTYNYKVDSVSYVTINNIVLKRLHIGYMVLTERFGWSSTLFAFNSYKGGYCKADAFANFMCYSDSTFGRHEFFVGACDSFGVLGVVDHSALSSFSIYPNPAQSDLFIEVPDEFIHMNTFAQILDVSGRVLHSENIKGVKRKSIDIGDIAEGIYTLRLTKENRPAQVIKWIKE